MKLMGIECWVMGDECWLLMVSIKFIVNPHIINT
jgi:predicted cobalt transporter CbtA